MIKIDFEDERRIRSTIWTLATLVFLVANLKLVTDTISILGLEASVSQSKILATLRLLLSASLVFFLARVAEKLPRLWARYLRWRDSKWWMPHQAQLDAHFEAEFRAHQGEPEMDWPPEWDEVLYAKKQNRKKKRLKVISYYRPLASLNRILGRIILPLAFGLTALFFPSSILVLETPPAHAVEEPATMPKGNE